MRRRAGELLYKSAVPQRESMSLNQALMLPDKSLLFLRKVFKDFDHGC